MIRVVHRVRRLIKQKKGRIVNVTSAFGRCPTPCIGPYLVSKYAATAYTDAIRKELSPWGIELWDRASDELKADYGLEFFNKTCDNQAMMMNGFGSNTTEKVTDAYVKAVTSLYTRRRYKVGWDTAFVWHPLSMMPTNLQDWAFYVMDLISRGPLPARVIAERQGKC
ncbi:unnamed protein product, partial [Mesorhabditis belari]|uniref:Uncharacterized protein n=1 Tax=Mesorhabditis belari TaxID=2138241 RepID=A0AAF3EMH3_9BILA